MLEASVAQLDQLLDRRLLTRFRAAEARLVGVHLRFAVEVVEAAIAFPRALRRFGIDLLEVGDDHIHGRVEAVEIEPVEADFCRSVGQGVVVLAQPLDELDDVGVAPHPDRKAPEARQGLIGARVVADTAHVAVDPVGVRPIRLDGDGGVARVGDQTLCDLHSLPVELMRPV